MLPLSLTALSSREIGNHFENKLVSKHGEYILREQFKQNTVSLGTILTETLGEPCPKKRHKRHLPVPLAISFSIGAAARPSPAQPSVQVGTPWLLPPVFLTDLLFCQGGGGGAGW